jgi:hypothetical protein
METKPFEGQVFVFKSKEAMEQFLVAGGIGGDVSGSISTGKDGSMRSFDPSIGIYQPSRIGHGTTGAGAAPFTPWTKPQVTPLCAQAVHGWQRIL